MKVNKKRRLTIGTIEDLWPPAMIMDTPMEKRDDTYHFTIRGPKKRVDEETELLEKRFAEAGSGITIKRIMATMARVEVSQDPCELLCSV